MADLSTDEALSKYVETCPEITLFTLIDSLGGLAWRMNHDGMRDGSRGTIPKTEADSMLASATKLYKRVEICSKQCVRFGVDPVLVKKHSSLTGGEVEVASDDYWLWYNWWKAYVKGLSDQEFRELDKAMIGEQDVSRWRPQGDWRARTDG